MSRPFRNAVVLAWVAIFLIAGLTCEARENDAGTPLLQTVASKAGYGM